MPFCPQCGNAIETGNIFCPHCGKKITSSVIDPSNKNIREEEFRAFIGKKADYYLNKFRFFENEGAIGFAITWSWSAFFLGFIWMLYRKMYLWALIAFFIALTPVSFPLAMIGWGIVGNYLYFLHVRNKIIDYQFRQTQTSMVPSQALAELGGVNRWVWFVGIIFFLFLLGIGILGFLYFLHFFEYAGFYKPQFIEI
jgi:hypothetical protein